jgi:hypothetical protein
VRSQPGDGRIKGERLTHHSLLPGFEHERLVFPAVLRLDQEPSKPLGRGTRKQERLPNPVLRGRAWYRSQGGDEGAVLPQIPPPPASGLLSCSRRQAHTPSEAGRGRPVTRGGRGSGNGRRFPFPASSLATRSRPGPPENWDGLWRGRSFLDLLLYLGQQHQLEASDPSRLGAFGRLLRGLRKPRP